MTESAQSVTAQSALEYGQQRPPRVVYAAVVITLVTSIGTVLVTLPLTIIGLWIGGPISDSFDPGSGDEARWVVAGAGFALIAVSITAGTLALSVLRRRTWASWLLIALSSGAALLGGIFGYYILPLIVTVVALPVMMLLLTRSARGWFRAAPDGQARRQPAS